MLQAGLFPDFKGADTLLLWGDAQGIAELREAIAALSRGDAATITVSELSISTSENSEQLSSLSRVCDGLRWVCPFSVLVESEGLIAGLDEASSGHQFIDITGLVDQVIVSKNEYPDTLRP